MHAKHHGCGPLKNRTEAEPTKLNKLGLGGVGWGVGWGARPRRARRKTNANKPGWQSKELESRGQKTLQGRRDAGEAVLSNTWNILDE